MNRWQAHRARRLARTIYGLQRIYVEAELTPAHRRGHLSDEWERLLRVIPLAWFRINAIEERVIDPATRILTRRMMRDDYRAGRWCGECRWGVVEDPPCCYSEAAR